MQRFFFCLRIDHNKFTFKFRKSGSEADRSSTGERCSGTVGVNGARKLSKDLAKRLLPESRVARLAWMAAMLTSVGLLLLPWIVRLNGQRNRHGLTQQFWGRFLHPLAVLACRLVLSLLMTANPRD